jgi:hypothetical protein
VGRTNGEESGVSEPRIEPFIAPFIAPDFSPPRVAKVGHLSLRVLAPEHTHEDYAAVMGSADRIRGVFGPDNDWPAPDLSLADNTADLVRHAEEFDARQAFAYSLWVGSDYAGCLYVRPFKSRRADDARAGCWDAVVYLWMSTPYAHDDSNTYQQLNQWLTHEWRMSRLAWPGRQMSWAQWEALA